MRLATLFQRLGYFGRCSFDAVVTGQNSHAGRVHWIECNGRWGGVSIPMSLVNRLTADDVAPSYAVVQIDSERFRAIKFDTVLREFADLRLSSDLTSGILFLTPTMTEAGSGCHFLSFGTDSVSASDQAECAKLRLQKD